MCHAHHRNSRLRGPLNMPQSRAGESSASPPIQHLLSNTFPSQHQPLTMYLRGPRITFFLLTGALVGAEVGLSAWSLAYGYEKKDKAAKVLPGASLDLTDAFAVGGTVTAAAGLSAILCNILLLYTVFHPRKPETLKSIRVKEALFGTIAFLLLGALIPATVTTATKSGVISAPGLPQSVIDTLVKSTGEDLRYRKQTPIIAYLIVGWIAWLSTIITGILVSIV